MSASSLCLCMIVRDERANLPGCLESVRGLADQIVVVDTGSTDGTREIALTGGAEVIETAWTGDFSLARNHGLERAGTDWILVLDADERLAEQSRESVRALTAGRPAAAYNLVTKSSSESGQHTLGHMVRLFPNRTDVRFEFPVHEQVNQSLVRAGIPIRDSGIEIEHLGYSTAAELARKAARNRGIIEEALRAAPAGPLALHLQYYYACSFYDGGDLSRAAAEYEDCLRKAGSAESKLGRVARLRAAECRFLLNEPARALEFLSADPDPSLHPAELCLRAEIEAGFGRRPDEARIWYEAVLGAPDIAYLPPVTLGILKFKALQFLGQHWARKGRKDIGVAVLKLAREIQRGAVNGATTEIAEKYRLIAGTGAVPDVRGAIAAEESFQKGLALQRAAKFEEAAEAYRTTLAIDPRSPEANNNLATALRMLGRCDEAIESCRRALEARPSYPDALNTLGSALSAQDRLDEAVAAFEKAVQIEPAHWEAWGNLGNALLARGQRSEALGAYRSGLALQPESPELRYNEGLAQLVLGNLKAGWGGFEYRWCRYRAREPRPFSRPRWAGNQSLEGRTILVHAEQGLGDTLQFFRFVPALAERGASVVLEVQAPLRDLLSFQGFARSVHSRGETLPKFDCHCPLLSLPKEFSTEIDSIPPGPYLRPPAEKAASWRGVFEKLGGPNVGLAWSGRAGHQNDRNRSIPLSLFAGIFKDLPANLFGLQKEIKAEDSRVLAGRSGITDLSGKLGDFTDSAAVVAGLDLVITVDTSVAHLAGALGVPAWVLLPFAPDWRWLVDRRGSPWYPSLRLFRQPSRGAWGAVIEEVGAELRQFVREHSPTP